MVGRTVIGAFVLAGALTACGGGDGDGGGGTGEVVELPSSVVCDGQGYDRAPAVGEGTDQVVVYVNGGSGWGYTSWGTSLQEGAEASVPEDASIAVCASVSEAGASVSCPFEDEGDEFTLVVSEATYDVTIRAASTGEVIDQGTATSEAAECPSFTSWSEGEGTRTEYAEAGADVAAMLEPSLA